MFRTSTIVGACFLIASGVATAGTLVVDIGRGPVTVQIPASYDPAQPAPLVLLLHGYTGTGQLQESYMQFLPLSEQFGFLYAYPDGTIDLVSNRFWNATDACCDLFGVGVDDSTYLSDLVQEISTQLNVDPWRIHLIGHSNGGFMSYRLACDHADTFAGLASLAGATYFVRADCSPVGPVNVLQIHGTNDGVIAYAGGSTNIGPFPGALDTVEHWASYNRCDRIPVATGVTLDLDALVPGAETTVSLHPDCERAAAAELWTIQGGGHSPALSADFSRHVVEFLYAHPKAGLGFDDPQTLSWPPLSAAVSYTVNRGSLADLTDLTYGDCVSDVDPDTTDTSFVDATIPASGTGFFYVQSFVDAGGQTSFAGVASDGTARQIAVPCP